MFKNECVIIITTMTTVYEVVFLRMAQRKDDVSIDQEVQ